MGLTRSTPATPFRTRFRNSLLRFCVLALLSSLTSYAQVNRTDNNPSDRNSFYSHFELARTLQQKGDSTRAAAEYKLFLTQALRNVATLHSHFGRYDQAQELMESAVKLSPDNPDLLLDFAAMRLDQENFTEARLLAEKSLKIRPNDPRAEYLIGNALCQQNDYQAAKPHLEAAVVGAPNFETGYLLGLTYLKLNDPKHAELLFGDMAKGLGDTAKLHIYLGRAYRNGGYVERAVEELKKAVALGANEPHVHYFLGLSYLGRDGNSGFDEAAPEFRAELERDPNDYRSRYLLGYILLKQHKVAEAETELTLATKLDPRNPDPLIFLGQVYMDTNRQTDAEKALRSAIALTDDPARNNYQISRAHYLLGRILMDSGNKDEARQEMRTASELGNKAIQLERQRISGDSPNMSAADTAPKEPDSASSTEERRKAQGYIDEIKPAVADSYNNLGVIAAGRQDFATALEDFRDAKKWQPSLETLDRNLGMAAFHADQFQEAVEPLARHLSTHPDDTRARAALALSFFGLEKYDRVRTILQSMETEIDNDPSLDYAYAVSLLKTGEYAQGINRLRGLEQTRSNSTDLHVLLANALAEQGEWAAALAEYQKALALDPKQARTHFLAGLAYIRLGKPAEGAQQMRTSLQLDPGDIASQYHLAYALIQLNNKDEAMTLLQKVIKRDPKYGDAFYELGKLQLERGDAEAAIPNLEASTRLKPDADYMHYQLAMAYRQASRPEDAKRELKVYQELKNQHRGRTVTQSK